MSETKTHSRKKTVETVNLTEDKCATLGAGEYQDKTEPALRFYVSEAGGRSFGLYKWSPKDQMAMRKTLGKWRPKSGLVGGAREQAKALALDIEQGKYTMTTKLTERKESKVTLGSMLDLYEKKLKQKERRKPNWASQALKHSFDGWRELPLSSITETMIEDKRDEIEFGDDEKGIEKRGPAAAGVALKALRAVFYFAIKSKHYRGDNPATFVEFPDEVARERVLTAKERGAIMQALDEGPWLTAHRLRIMSSWRSGRTSPVRRSTMPFWTAKTSPSASKSDKVA